jgi:murein DD-endopeptidase MepM/ murein hydrolase activator NlpD
MGQPPATPPTDRDPSGLQQTAFAELSTRVVRTIAHYRQQSRADQNLEPPRPQVRFGKLFYESAPVQLVRPFGSPVARTGPYARGPHKERVIASGWGDARSTAYDGAVNANRLHMGLDFTAPFGEQVLACADGNVTFVGFEHRRRRGVHVDGPREDPQGNVRDRHGGLVALGAGPADQLEVGFGGIIVFVEHSGDFASYRTEYMHLSDVLVREGDRVSAGQAIAKVGGSGGYYGHFTTGIHLHFQLAYVSGQRRVIVRPTGLVPYYWPGHDEGDASPTTFPLTTGGGTLSVGESVAASGTANQIQAVDRARTLEHRSRADFKREQAAHAMRVADQLTAQQAALHEAEAKFQDSGIVIDGPMTFDFSTGRWTPDGHAV